MKPIVGNVVKLNTLFSKIPINITKQILKIPFETVIVAKNFLGFLRCLITNRLRISLCFSISFNCSDFRLKYAASAPVSSADIKSRLRETIILTIVNKSIVWITIFTLVISANGNGSAVSNVIGLGLS